MKKSKITNTIGISQDPYSFEKIYKGRCNGLSFNLIYMGRYNAGTESIDESIDIMWQSEVTVERSKQLEEGIRKVFRNRLNAEKG